MKKILVIVGSLRKDSINRTLAKALEKLSGPKFEFTYADIGSLPHYNDDLWPDVPESVVTLKQLISASDGVLFVTPEYNRSTPGIVKNAIDWASRPYGKNVWSGKPASVIGASTGAIGTAVAQSHLRSILPILGLILLGQPEVYFRFTPGLINQELEITDEQTRSFLELYLAKFESWIDQFPTKE